MEKIWEKEERGRELPASKLTRGFIKIYLRHLKDSNTKISSELNASLEKV